MPGNAQKAAQISGEFGTALAEAPAEARRVGGAISNQTADRKGPVFTASDGVTRLLPKVQGGSTAPPGFPSRGLPKARYPARHRGSQSGRSSPVVQAS